MSDYVWRGADQQAGFCVQPSLTFSYAGFALNFWGSQTLSKWTDGKGQKEVDINLSYTYRNFTVSLSDYWWAGTAATYGDYQNDHYFEAGLKYNFGEKFPLELAWNTMFAGADRNEQGKLMASTYISASYPIALPADITVTPSVGFTPWKGLYWDKAAFTDVKVAAARSFQLKNNLRIPVSVQLIYSPIFDRAYILGGVGFAF